MKRTIYRLRKATRVVGILEKSRNGIRYKSKSRWWMRGIPNYDEIDEGVGINDKHGNDIFELDILKINDPVEEKTYTGIVLWKKDEFGILYIDTKIFVPLKIQGLDMFRQEDLLIVDQLYTNEKLTEELGLENL